MEVNNTDNAVSIYNQEGSLDDFPVLKAFQQYIDAEQEKSRKRMLSLCIFFGCLMTVVITVFVVMLISISERNQKLNDRLIDFAMNREHAPQTSPVVVQPPSDNSAILALTSKLDAMQKKMAEDQAKAEKTAADAAEHARLAAIEAAKPKGPSPSEIEIKKLKALLAAERERNSIEKERLRQAEIEAYRRKHYPELYENKSVRTSKPKVAMTTDVEKDVDDMAEIAEIIEEIRAKTNFDDDNATLNQEKKRPTPIDATESSALWNIPTE